VYAAAESCAEKIERRLVRLGGGAALGGSRQAATPAQGGAAALGGSGEGATAGSVGGRRMANGLDVRVILQNGFPFHGVSPGLSMADGTGGLPSPGSKPRGLSSARTSSSVKTAIKQHTAPELTGSQLEANIRSPALRRAIFVFVMWT